MDFLRNENEFCFVIYAAADTIVVVGSGIMQNMFAFFVCWNCEYLLLVGLLTPTLFCFLKIVNEIWIWFLKPGF